MTKRKNQTKPAKERSTLLAIALVAVILHGIIMAAVYWTVLPDAQRGVQNISVWIMFLTAVADIVAGVALWRWKQWGIYLFGIATIAGAVIVMLHNPFLLFGSIIPAIIVLYIIMMQRGKFE
ncbi:MAG: hypothetical protein R6W76_11080 [Caldilinea sp.]